MGQIHQVMDSHQDQGPKLCLPMALAGTLFKHSLTEITNFVFRIWICIGVFQYAG